MNVTTLFRPLTVDEFQNMAEQGLFAPNMRLELIDGRIHEMSPVGRKHAAIVVRLMAYFPPRLGDGYTYSAQNPVQLLPKFQPQPDYMILRYRDDDYEFAMPTARDVLLLIEVSDSTLVDDLTLKLPRYAKAQIPEVWIINVNDSTVMQFLKPNKNKEAYLQQNTHQRGETIFTTLEISVPVDSVFK